MMKRFRLNEEQFYKMQTSNFVELPFKIDIDEFNKDIEPYKPLFRDWGEKHHDIMFRKGLPLVNITGNLDDEIDPSMYPLDAYNETFNTDIWDNDFTIPTEILDLPCFDCLDPIKHFMIRSAILWWKRGSFFYPHIDTELPADIIRIWGTNKPEGYLFTYLDGTNHTHPEWEPGRLYVCDTVKEHYAEALEDDVFTFFICLSAKAYDTIKDLTHGK